MLFYQKTPARYSCYELVEKVHFQKGDVFMDLGAGSGQVSILVNLLAGISGRGIEFEPAFCAYSRNCARELNLSQVDFVNADAREADYSEETVFFMFTPFKGRILGTVLALLRKESLRRKIKIITYGPCTIQVAQESWLRLVIPDLSICINYVFLTAFRIEESLNSFLAFNSLYYRSSLSIWVVLTA